MLILLPYYIINYEKKLSGIANDTEKENALMSEYKSIINHLEVAVKDDETGMFQDILQMMRKLMYYLLRKQPKLKERMSDIMGGKVLPLPSDKLREARKAGIIQSISALIETCKEFHARKEDTVLRIEKKFSLSTEEALSLVEKYW